MAKQSPNIQKVGQGVQLPAFIPQSDVGMGMEQLKEFVIVPRAKIVQRQSDTKLTDAFKPGSIVLSPVQALLAEPEAPLTFTPIMFYPEWITWNPIETKGSEPAIAFRTLDRNDPVVAKARDPRLRKELLTKIGGKDVYRSHTEHLNFVILLHDHPITDPLVLSLARSEHFTGQKFAGLIRMRKAPMFACKFSLKTGPRKNNLGEWFGFDIEAPADGNGWVSEEQYEFLKGVHVEYDELVQARRVQADLSEPDEEPTGSAPADGERTM